MTPIVHRDRVVVKLHTGIRRVSDSNSRLHRERDVVKLHTGILLSCSLICTGIIVVVVVVGTVPK